MAAELPFWKTKTLAQMNTAEWESLCDGCGRCCLHKLRDEETDRIIHTEVSCRLLDTESCLCSDYPRRRRKVPDCVQLTPATLAEIDWLPPNCGYRRVAEGLDLEWWHPLLSGSGETVHQAGVSVRGRVISERVAGALEDHVANWPGEPPPAARSGKAASGKAASGKAASGKTASGQPVVRRLPGAAGPANGRP